MDKLRAMHYFHRAAELGSFTAAARALEVSTPAITQLIGALEQSLGVALFRRSTRRLELTAEGERYYEASRRVTADFEALEQNFRPRGAKPRGSLTVGMRSGVGRHCVMPRIGEFLARFPDVELMIKRVDSIDDIGKSSVDVAVLTGWPPERELAVRILAKTRHVVCASPQYWMRAGRPERPEDLLQHQCLIFRSAGGALLDRWIFEKAGERRVVDVNGRLLGDDRSWVEEAAQAGVGVARLADLIISDHLSAGVLVPVLTDWQAIEAPLIFVAYPPRQRQSRLVRAFVDFLVELFEEFGRKQSALAPRLATAATPAWFGRAHGRQSAFAARKGERRIERG